MKGLTKIGIAVGLIVWIMSGCSDPGSRESVKTGNSVGEVISDQMQNAEANASDTKPSISDPQTEAAAIEGKKFTEHNADTDDHPDDPYGVDYDLTAMNSDMVYATVYQMMVDPDAYIGKSIRMNGLYYIGRDKVTDNIYHYCIIKDAMACCAQGLEFVWGDGTHVYPDEYPEINTMVEVQGIFDTYVGEDGYPYARLRDATLQSLGESE